MNLPYSILVNKCRGSFNNINDLYAKSCVSDVVKDMNIKVFNLMSKTSETRRIKWHKTCVCKNKHWNNDTCRYECEKLIDKDICDDGFIWNPSISEFECDKSFSVG